MSRVAMGALMGYPLMRAMGYVMEPRPYLWWHGAIDIVLLSIIVAVLIISLRMERAK